VLSVQSLSPYIVLPQSLPANAQVTVSVVLDADGKTVGTVSPLLFGAIAINKYGWTNWLDDHHLLGTTFMSWPGGTIAEDGVLKKDGAITTSGTVTFWDLQGDRSMIAYDLTHACLISPVALSATCTRVDVDGMEVAPMDEVVAHTLTHGTPLSLVLPVVRYFEGLDFTLTRDRAMSREQLLADLSIFLGRLNSDHWNNGNLPKRIVFEIGNEPYGNPIEYAFTARTYIEQTRKVFGDRIEIAFQMNKGSAQLKALDDNGYMDQWFRADGVPKIAELGGLRYTGYENMTFDERQLFIEKMMIKILGPAITEIDLLRHHTLSITGRALQDPNSLLNQRGDILDYWRDAITRAGGDGSKVGYYISAWTVSSADDPDGPGPYGMAAAPVAVMLIADFIRDGVDMAVVWGLVAAPDYPSKGLTDTTMTVHDSDAIAPHGLVYGLMANNIQGMRLVENGTDGELDYKDPTDTLIVSYEGETSTIVYIAVGDISASGLTVAVDLSGYSYSTVAEISMVGTESGADFGPGTVTVTQKSLQDGLLWVPFSQDYGVAQVKIRVNNFDGSNEIGGTGGADRLRGTAGRDAIVAYGGHDVLFGDGGDDRIHAGSGNDHLYGGTGRDRLYGETGDDRIVGGDGNDLLYGGANNDTLYGGNGNDDVHGEAANDTLYGEAGNDRLFGGSGNDSLWGGDGNDSLWGSDGFDLIYGGNGNDRVWAGSHNDLVHGDAGNDTIYGQGGNDSLWGGAGNDQILGGEGNDTIWGGDGNDDLRGETGNDTLYGQNGNDRLYGGAGNDQALGGTGNDTLWGGDGNDDLRGDAGNDSLYGGNGNDLLFGGADHDLLNGGTGDDVLWGGTGNDTLWGGYGDDGLYGDDGNDLLYGQDGDDWLFGGRGNDELFGSTGNDRIEGGAGNDLIDGGSGNDILFGGDGNDTLWGGSGNDRMTGGSGADRFVFSGGQDMITDFTDNVDEIALASSLWSGPRPSVAAIVDAAIVTSAGTILVFEGGRTLTIEGLTDPNRLLDDIVFV